MAYAGNGIDAFCWIKIPNGSNSNTIMEVIFTNSAGVEVWSMSMTVDNLVGLSYEITGASSGNAAFATSANYRLFELWYNPAFNCAGVRVNDAALFSTQIVVPSTMATAAKGSVRLTHDRRTAGTAAAECCELAVYPIVLNATQRNYIFNAGAGRTWPVTLP
jgi:hypothetical protein